MLKCVSDTTWFPHRDVIHTCWPQDVTSACWHSFPPQQWKVNTWLLGVTRWAKWKQTDYSLSAGNADHTHLILMMMQIISTIIISTSWELQISCLLTLNSTLILSFFYTEIEQQRCRKVSSSRHQLFTLNHHTRVMPQQWVSLKSVTALSNVERHYCIYVGLLFTVSITWWLILWTFLCM